MENPHDSMHGMFLRTVIYLLLPLFTLWPFRKTGSEEIRPALEEFATWLLAAETARERADLFQQSLDMVGPELRDILIARARFLEKETRLPLERAQQA